jgi:hypothetical protein
LSLSASSVADSPQGTNNVSLGIGSGSGIGLGLGVGVGLFVAILVVGAAIFWFFTQRRGEINIAQRPELDTNSDESPDL